MTERMTDERLAHVQVIYSEYRPVLEELLDVLKELFDALQAERAEVKRLEALQDRDEKTWERAVQSASVEADDLRETVKSLRAAQAWGLSAAIVLGCKGEGNDKRRTLLD
jgi:hypothetical protein